MRLMPHPTICFSLVLLFFSAGLIGAHAQTSHDLVPIPGGTFLRGDALGSADEQPVQEVRVDSFMLAQSEVTVAQFATFASATGYDSGLGCNWYVEGELVADPTHSWRNPGFQQDPSHPAVCVSWIDAQAYVAWVNAGQTDHVYRLPTEAEWEYVAGLTYPQRKFTARDDICLEANGVDRALMEADTGAFTFGNADLYGADDQRAFTCDDGAVYTSPAGRRQLEPFGISGLLGNVWEYVQDCTSDDYAHVPRDGSAYEPVGCTRRGIRGGGWNTGPAFMTVPNRSNMAPDGKNWGIGFRLAAD